MENKQLIAIVVILAAVVAVAAAGIYVMSDSGDDNNDAKDNGKDDGGNDGPKVDPSADTKTYTVDDLRSVANAFKEKFEKFSQKELALTSDEDSADVTYYAVSGSENGPSEHSVEYEVKDPASEAKTEFDKERRRSMA